MRTKPARVWWVGFAGPFSTEAEAEDYRRRGYDQGPVYTACSVCGEAGHCECQVADR